MFYLDTCIIVSYIFESDRKHESIAREINELKKQGSFHISLLTLLELYITALVRLTCNKWKMPGMLKGMINQYPTQD